VPLSDKIHGINMIMSPELLHTIGAGIVVYIIAIIKDSLIDASRTEVDILFNQVCHDLKKNCNNDYYECSLHKGAKETVKQSTSENIDHL